MANFIYLVINIFILSYSFIMGVAISRRNFRLSRPLALAGLAVLFAQCAITFLPEYEYALLGFSDYAFVRWWGIAGAFLTFGARFDSMHPGIRNLLILICIAISLLFAIYWDLAVTENGYAFAEKGWSGEICAQSTAYTSAPAACATMLKHYGVNTSEKEMAARCFTDRRGTLHIYIALGLKSMLDASAYKVAVTRTGWEGLDGVPAPFVTSYLRPDGFLHTVSVLEKTAGAITFADPLSAEKVTATKEEFVKVWDSIVIYAAKR